MNMISSKDKRIIVEWVAKRPDFIMTLNECKEATQAEPGDEDREFVHEFSAFELFDTVIIYANFNDRRTTDTEFYIYDRQTALIRDVTQEEDAMLRHLDQEVEPINERQGVELLIWRNPDNTIGVNESCAKAKVEVSKCSKRRR
jgi:hypothetical protein